MGFQIISALRAFGGEVKKNVYFQIGQIRSHGRIPFCIFKRFRALGGDVKKNVHFQSWKIR